MGTLLYNDANIPNPTVSDFESSSTLLYTSSTQSIYFMSTDSAVYAGAYVLDENSLMIYLCSSISTTAKRAKKVEETFILDNTTEISTLATVGDTTIYRSSGIYMPSSYEYLFEPFDTIGELLEAVSNAIYLPSYPIIYRLTNATTTGPNGAIVGNTVTVPLTFPEGYGVVNPSSDAYVTCNGVLVPSTYSNGQLVFTMPDPS